MAKRHHEHYAADSSDEDHALTCLLPAVTASTVLTRSSSKKMRDTSLTENSCRAVYVVTRSEMMAYFTLLGKT